MKTYLEAQRLVNPDRHDPERQRDRGWRSVGQIADDLGPYFAALRGLQTSPGAGSLPDLAESRDGSLRPVRPRPHHPRGALSRGSRLARRMERAARGTRGSGGHGVSGEAA
jgi:hypothetical protein